jgi:predicted RNA-binding protein with RPS1 domain
VATLKKNQEVTGVVVKLYPYGAIIDIGANVNGLLHITKVASVMNRYVDKEKGLKSAGLEKGAKVRLMVESVEKRRLSLDFTDDVKEEAKEEARKEKMDKEEPKILEQQLVDEYDYSPNNDDVEAWAEYANQGALNEKEDEEEVGSSSIDDDYDDKYDEEFDIESNLGLDMY